MNENLRDEIRALVHEEMSSPRQNIPPRTNIVARTRELIRQNSISSIQASPSPSSLRSTPNHSLRINDRGRKRKIDDRNSTFELTVLQKNESKKIEYTISETICIMKQVMLNLRHDMVESEIKDEICKAIHPRIKINASEFLFVKRERNKIIIPQHDDKFVFNYPQVKKLVGQGKLYIQLKDNCLFFDDSDGSDYETPCSSREAISNSYATTPCSSREASSNSNQAIPCSSREATLIELFPDLDEEHRMKILDTTDTLEEAADAAASVSDEVTSVLDGVSNVTSDRVSSIYDVFDILSRKMKPERKPMKVSEESLVTDVLSYYKDNKFDPTFTWRVSFQNQAGVDAGGLTRELFHLFFKKLCDSNEPNFRLFEGKRFKLLPTCRTDTCISNIFKHIGGMMAHCLCQGIRPLILSEVAYRYIIYGDIQATVSYVNINDVATESIAFYVNEIMEADSSKLRDLAENAEFQQLVEETGEFIYLTENSKERVLQSLLIYDTLIKRKPSYDLIRDGLKTNGVLKLMQAYPEVCKDLIVFSKELDGITPVNFLREVTFEEANQGQKEIFKSTIDQFSKEELSRLLHFVTGSEDFTALKSDKITVKFNNSNAVFASSCLFELSVPLAVMSSSKALKDVLLYTIEGDNFNTV